MGAESGPVEGNSPTKHTVITRWDGNLILKRCHRLDARYIALRLKILQTWWWRCFIVITLCTLLFPKQLPNKTRLSDIVGKKALVDIRRDYFAETGRLASQSPIEAPTPPRGKKKRHNCPNSNAVLTPASASTGLTYTTTPPRETVGEIAFNYYQWDGPSRPRILHRGGFYSFLPLLWSDLICCTPLLIIPVARFLANLVCSIHTPRCNRFPRLKWQVDASLGHFTLRGTCWCWDLYIKQRKTSAPVPPQV